MTEKDAITMRDEEVLAGATVDPNLFGVIVERYQSAFLRKALAILRDENLAADAVQEAFVKIYLAASRFKKVEGATFSSWAYRILVNECYTIYNKNKKHRERTTEFDELIEAVLPDHAVVLEQKKKLDADEAWSFVSRLPVIFRRVIELSFFEDKSPAEIAAIEGVSENVVRVRVYRAKAMLQKIYRGTYAS